MVFVRRLKNSESDQHTLKFGQFSRQNMNETIMLEVSRRFLARRAVFREYLSQIPPRHAGWIRQPSHYYYQTVDRIPWDHGIPGLLTLPCSFRST
jgi:hypothetical protein